MKNLFNLFKKKTPSSNATSPTIQFNVGDSSAEFIPRSKTSLILAGLLVVALAAFGYRYVSNRNATVAPPITIMGKNPAEAKVVGEPKDSVAAAQKLFKNSQLDDSIAIYLNLLKKAPRDAQALNDLGVLYLKKQKYQESEYQLKRSLEVAPECAVCLNNLGYLKTLEGKSAEAENYLKKAIALNSAYTDPYFNLGVLYEKNGDLERSADAYREFLQRSKKGDSQFNLNLEQHIHSILEK